MHAESVNNKTYSTTTTAATSTSTSTSTTTSTTTSSYSSRNNHNQDRVLLYTTRTLFKAKTYSWQQIIVAQILLLVMIKLQHLEENHRQHQYQSTIKRLRSTKTSTLLIRTTIQDTTYGDGICCNDVD